jgi:hypothetical protein
MIEFIGLICITVLSVNATPILLLRDKLGLLEMDEKYPMWRNRIIELLSCPMCLGFWIGFLFYIFSTHLILDSIFLGAIISILSEILNKILRR